MLKGYTFDDVLIRPKYSEVESRSLVDLSTTLGKDKNLYLGMPIVSANMKAITGPVMAKKIASLEGLALLHRFCTRQELIAMFNEVLDEDESYANYVGISIGTKEEDLDTANSLIARGAKIVCIDVAHGAQKQVVNQHKQLKMRHPHVFTIVGNFATPDSILRFEMESGYYTPDVYKIGIGPGAACLTRIKTGVGIPQLSAIEWCSRALAGISIIADGGCRNPCDVAKAIAAGADAVMLGGMLAGTKEANDTIRDEDGTYRCYYYGSAYTDNITEFKTSEGAYSRVQYKGPVDLVLDDIKGGIRSAAGYVNALNLSEFKAESEFIQVTGSTLLENSARI